MSWKTLLTARSAEVSKSRFSLVVAGSAVAGSFLALLLLGLPALSQQPDGYPPRGPAAQTRPAPAIAVIDISVIFKKHLGFKQAMAAMDADVKRAEEIFKGKKEDFQTRAAVLKNLAPGSQDYSAKEKELATLQSELNVEVQLQQKQFMQKEAGVYYSTYQEIQAEVDAIAAANGLAVVLKVNGDPPNAQDPKAILSHLNKDVVWYDHRLDITNLVADRINAKYGNANARRDVGVPPR
jgi:Skp family chaperone for outer membrane proteins